MESEYLLKLFLSCLDADYTDAEGGGSYATVRDGERLYIFFEKSNGYEDWWNNLSYRAVPRGRKNDGWLCHEGFLKVFEGIRPNIEKAIKSPTVKNIVTVGYSHGAALALLCHEYIWYTRVDLRNSIAGYGFGCPRVVWGRVKNEKQRWRNFYVIRNIDDIVTHVPPAIFGYMHKGNLIEIGNGDKNGIDAHRAENYIATLSCLGT